MIANVALAVNVVLLVAIMSLLQAVLTLPGIAGIVLTVVWQTQCANFLESEKSGQGLARRRSVSV